MYGAEPQFATKASDLPAPRISIMDELGSTLEALGHNLTLLEQRLCCVSLPEYDGPTESDPHVKPVASPIREILDGFERQTQRVGNILDRLEV